MQNESARFFNRGHFPAGTVVQYQFSPDQEMKEGTISRVLCNGARSWIAEVDDADAKRACTTAFNLDHVKRIVKRGEGPLVIHSTQTPRIGGLKHIFNREYHENVATHGKGKGEYLIANVSRFITNIVAVDNRYRGIVKDHYLDVGAMGNAMLSSSALKPFDCTPPSYCDNNHRTMWRIKKTKFHSLLKQLLSKHKLNRRAQERQEYDEYNPFPVSNPCQISSD